MGRARNKETGLTEAEERFCQAFLTVGETLGNASAAYRASHDTSRMKRSTVNRNSYDLSHRPRVQARIEELRKKLAERTEFNAFDVLRQWVEIATADPNELMQSRRVCCRFCHGKDHLYQWSTVREFAQACTEAIHFAARNTKPDLPSDEGGYGFNVNDDPHPNCPECFGNGIHQVFIADSRKLKGPARRLYAGIKYKRDGVEILLRNQDQAVENIAKYLGMFKDKLATPPGTQPAPPEPISKLTSDPVEASKIYQKIMGATG